MKRTVAFLMFIALLCTYLTIPATAAIIQVDGKSYDIEYKDGSMVLDGFKVDRCKTVFWTRVLSFTQGVISVPVFVVPASGTKVTFDIDPDTVTTHDFGKEGARKVMEAGYYNLKSDGVYYNEGGKYIPIDTDISAGTITFTLPLGEFFEQQMDRSVIIGVKVGNKEFFYVLTDDTDAKSSDETVVYNESPFTDVDSSKYYYEPVLWALKQKILSADSEKFMPEAISPRSEVVTWIWKAMGSPEPTLAVNPFTDISEEDDCYKAALWAYEKGITSGTGATTFGPDSPCTRAQVITFLWRAIGKPIYAGVINFTDIPIGAYYLYPMFWAVNEGITSGTSPWTFSPEMPCARAHIITFLYRTFAEKQ